ncbi:hypothetical protein [Salinimicrobium sp. GXAS 041]|uniref:hypothetical protein n=1 Tax=Salinimicrobium sp. GXAS 041 TaxID=3400806 RepID=UPI003C78AE73
MDVSAIELQLRQVDVAFSKSRINVYSDKKKEQHYNELYDLFCAIDQAPKSGLISENELNIHFQILNYILNGLEYLDSSTLNNIPFEIVSCLEYVLDEWIVDKNFIIVTSLSNRHLEYLFSTYFNAELFSSLNEFIKEKYNLSITNRLIRITLPKSLSRDYLASMVLYHELGHFIDSELAVSTKFIAKKYGFDKINDHISEFKHTKEYFADIFAAQYINDASNYFLERITPNGADLDNYSHPSLTKRKNTVEGFLEGTNIHILKEFNNILKYSENTTLKRRHKLIDEELSCFNKLIPENIESKEELHSVFKLAWDIWLNSDNNFLKNFSSKEKYNVINNLVEKTISNYTILEKWN